MFKHFKMKIIQRLWPDSWDKSELQDFKLNSFFFPDILSVNVSLRCLLMKLHPAG